MRKLLKILLYIVIAFIILFWGGILILSVVGGNSDRMKSEVEKVMGSVFGGRTVQITTLHHAALYPELSLDAEKIMIGSPEEVVRDGREGYFVGKIAFVIPFWGVFFNQPEIRVLVLENIFPIANDPLWMVHTAYFNDDSPGEDSNHNLYIQATYDKIPFNISMGAEYMGEGYRFSGTTPVKGIAGDYEFEALSAPDDGIFLLEDIVMGPEELRIKGTIEANRDMWLAGFQMGEGHNVTIRLVPEEIEGKPTSFSGEISFTRFEPHVLEALSLFWQKMGHVIADMGIPGETFDVNIIADTLDSKLKLDPKGRDISTLSFTGQGRGIPVEFLQPYVNQPISGEGPVDVDFDLKGDLHFHPFRTKDMAGFLHVTFADGEEREIPLSETTFLREWK